MAKLALQAKLVDKLATRDEVRKRLIELVGEDKEKKSFKQVAWTDYLANRGGDRSGSGRGNAVAVIVAKGDILDGSQPAGHHRRRLDGAADPPRARGRLGEGRRAARRQRRRQRLRLRDHPPRVRADARRRQAGGGLDGQRGGLGRLLDRDRVRRDLGAAGDDHRLDRDLRHLPHRRQAAGEVPRRPHGRRRDDPLHRRAPPRPTARPGGRADVPVVHRPRLRRVPRARGAGAQDEQGAGGQDRARADLERRGREGHSAWSTSWGASSRPSSRRRSGRSSPRATGSGTSRRTRPSASASRGCSPPRP